MYAGHDSTVNKKMSLVNIAIASSFALVYCIEGGLFISNCTSIGFD